MKSGAIPLAVESAGRTVEAAARIPLTRRELLKGAGVLFGTLALSSGLAMFAPSRAWALELQQLAITLEAVRAVKGHSKLEAICCLKLYIAREVYCVIRQRNRQIGQVQIAI